MFGPPHTWTKPVMVWAFKCHPQWFTECRDVLAKIEDALVRPDEDAFARALLDVQLDNRVGAEANDFRQWFFTSYRYTALPLVMQHYGMPTTALDVTSDVDVALFFVLNRFDPEAGHFLPVAKHQRLNPVLYLFASASEGVPTSPLQTAILPSDYLLRSAGPAPLPIPPRIARQQCGLLYGANVMAENRYALLLIGKVDMRAYIGTAATEIKPELFPGSLDDSLYGTLLAARPVPYRLVIYRSGNT